MAVLSPPVEMTRSGETIFVNTIEDYVARRFVGWTFVGPDASEIAPRKAVRKVNEKLGPTVSLAIQDIPGLLDALADAGAGGGGGGGGLTEAQVNAIVEDLIATKADDSDVTGEASARAAADSTLGGRIDTEITDRTTADSALTTALGGKAATSHTHTSSQITDFTEAAQDAVAALLAGASGVSLSYDDAANTLTVTGSGAAGLDAEAVRDAIGVAMIGTSPITVAVNDAADTITISTTATANSTDAALRDRSTHTGTQSLDTTTDSATRLAMTTAERSKLAGVATSATANDTDANLKARANHTGTQSLDTTTDSATRLAMTAAERTKLSGVATSATANDTDANLKDRANHTGTQTSATISDFTEAAQDAIAALLAGASGVSLSYNDAANTLTVTGAGDTSALAEQMRDTIGVALIGSGVISVAVNDGADTITISSTATANSTDAALRDRSTHTGTQAASTITGLAAVATSGAKADVALGNVDNTSNATERAAAAVLTNKRITKRVYSTADTATLTIASDDYDGAKVTALAQNMTIAAPTGTPTDMQLLSIRITDAGTIKTLTWNAAFRAMGTALPTATIANKTFIIGCQWDSDDSVWNVLGVTKQP